MLDGWLLCGAERRLRHVERHDTRDCSVVVSVVVRPGATVESGSPLSGSCDYASRTIRLGAGISVSKSTVHNAALRSVCAACARFVFDNR